MPRLNFGVSAEASLFCNADELTWLARSGGEVLSNMIKLLQRCKNQVILPYSVSGFSHFVGEVFLLSQCHREHTWTSEADLADLLSPQVLPLCRIPAVRAQDFENFECSAAAQQLSSSAQHFPRFILSGQELYFRSTRLETFWHFWHLCAEMWLNRLVWLLSRRLPAT